MTRQFFSVPAVYGCALKKRPRQPSSDLFLVEENHLSKNYEDALSQIFREMDLDGNGSLSFHEFNLYNWRTSGQQIKESDWKLMEKSVPFVKNEMTREAFLQIHLNEAKSGKSKFFREI